MGVKDRILEFIGSKNIPIKQFEERCSLSNGYVSSMRKGFGVGKLENVLSEFPELNREWILFGEGEMLKESENNSSIPTINYEKIGVPYYDVDFIGGFDLTVNDQTANASYYVDFKEYSKADYWVNITGHSMEPLISHGDMIAIKQLHDWTTFMLYGEIYAIVTSEYRTVKRVRKGTTPDTIRLIPMNPDYDEQEIPKSIVMAVFLVQGCAKKIF